MLFCSPALPYRADYNLLLKQVGCLRTAFSFQRPKYIFQYLGRPARHRDEIKLPKI